MVAYIGESTIFWSPMRGRRPTARISSKDRDNRAENLKPEAEPARGESV